MTPGSCHFHHWDLDSQLLSSENLTGQSRYLPIVIKPVNPTKVNKAQNSKTQKESRLNPLVTPTLSLFKKRIMSSKPFYFPSTATNQLDIESLQGRQVPSPQQAKNSSQPSLVTTLCYCLASSSSKSS